MAQAEQVLTLENGKKLVIVTGIAGPASYATGGFTVTVNSLRFIDNVVSITPTTNKSTTDHATTYDQGTLAGNTFKIKVNDQNVTNAATAATWAELAATTNISAVIFTAIVIGY